MEPNLQADGSFLMRQWARCDGSATILPDHLTALASCRNTHGHLFLPCELAGCSPDAFQSVFDAGYHIMMEEAWTLSTVALCRTGCKLFEEMFIFRNSEEEHPLVSSLDDIR